MCKQEESEESEEYKEDEDKEEEEEGEFGIFSTTYGYPLLILCLAFLYFGNSFRSVKTGSGNFFQTHEASKMV